VVDERGVDEHLPKADIVVMVLPREPSTVRALDARRIDLLPRHAWVINVGRGSTVDEETLVDRVSMGHLGGAALDVFEQEPLPPSSRLWATPNVIVSPHAAGGRPVGAGLLIRENLDAMLAGRPMRNTVSARGLDTWKD
jgi:phosphoglycerate dehydrogenase-like enzyme